MVATREQFGGGTTCRHIAGTRLCMSAAKKENSDPQSTARIAAHRQAGPPLATWLAALLFLFAALAAVPVSATASAKALCVPQNRIGEHSATAPLGMLPTIASPDWSKNLFVSNDPAHGISKFLGGQAVTTLATAGASELPEALSSGTEEATNLLPGATTGVTDLADANTATTLSEDAVKTPTANTVTAKVPSAAGKATEEELTRFGGEGGGQVQGARGGGATDRMGRPSNKAVSRLRETRLQKRLESHFGQTNVLRERTILDASGKKVVDPVTGEGRRIDFVVRGENGDARFAVEATSKKQVSIGGKADQLAKEARIRNRGGQFVRDPHTGKLIDISKVPTRIIGTEPER